MTRLLLAIALVACGGRSPASRPAPPPGHHDPGPIAEAAPSEPECDALVDHMIGLALAEQPDPQLTDDEHAQLRTAERTQILPRCLLMHRKLYTCAIAASSLTAFTACDASR